MNFNFADFLLTFMSIIFEAMPFIVIGAIVSGLLEILLPQQFFNRWLPKNRLLAIMGSSLMGFILPMCECGIVPVMRRLLAKGAPPSCAVTYMLSAPVINPIVLASTSLAFWGSLDLWDVGGLKMVLLRAGGAFVTAVTVGLLFERLSRRGESLVRDNVGRARLVDTEASHELYQIDAGPLARADHGAASPHAHDHGHSHGPAKQGLLDKLSAIAEIALGDFLDIAAFLVIGAALAASVRTALPTEKLDELAQYGSLSIIGMMALAYVLSLCSEADAFVAANFVSFSLGSKVAFLVLGPMLDIKLTIMYRWVFTRKAVRIMAVTLVVCVFLVGLATNLASPWLVSTGSS